MESGGSAGETGIHLRDWKRMVEIAGGYGTKWGPVVESGTGQKTTERTEGSELGRSSTCDFQYAAFSRSFLFHFLRRKKRASPDSELVTKNWPPKTAGAFVQSNQFAGFRVWEHCSMKPE